jgi:hypothetical protein
MKPKQAERIAEEIIDLYTLYGEEEYSGEKVSQLEHMVQAAQLAKAEGYNDEVVLAAFLHDVGHIAEKITESNAMDGLPGWWNRMWRPKDILLSGNPDTMINFQKQVKKLWNFKVDPCRMRKRISWKKISFSGKLSRCVAGMNQQNGNTCQRPP